MAPENFLEKALVVLKNFNIIPSTGAEESRLAGILNEVSSVDEPKIIAIANTVRYMSGFNELVRDNVKKMDFSDRYNDITQKFDSIREDYKTLVEQIADDRIDTKERLANWWMKVRRGTPHDRFEDIKGLYLSVTEDTKKQLDSEKAIMEAYTNYRWSIKEAEGMAWKVYEKQVKRLEKAQARLDEVGQAAQGFEGEASKKAGLELKRDQAKADLEAEESRYQLLKDVAENLSNTYNVGDTLMMKLKQTHDLKDQIYKRAVTFFTLNESVFTTLDAVYTSQFGLGEQTKAIDAMKAGQDKALEDLADFGRKIEVAAYQAGYGATINSASVQKLVDSIVEYQTQHRMLIAEARGTATKESEAIRSIVEEGKRKVAQTITNYQTKAA